MKVFIILRAILQVFMTTSIVGFYYLGWYKPIWLGGLTLGYAFLPLTFLFILLMGKRVHEIIQLKIFIYICCFSLFLFLLQTVKIDKFSLNALIDYAKPIVLFFLFYSFTVLYGLGEYFLKLILALVSTSIFFAILQFGDLDIGWEVRNYLPYIESDVVRNQIESRSREPGLAYYSVQLQYQIHSFLAAAVVFFNWRKKGVHYFLFGVALLALVLGMKSAFISTLLFYFIIRGGIKKSSYVKGAIGLVFFILLIMQSQVDWHLSIMERMAFLIVGLYIISQNPFGVANMQSELGYAIGALEKYSEYFVYSDHLYGASFHNIFINIAFSTGWLGLIILTLLYFLLYFFYNKKRGTNRYALVGEAYVISNLTLVLAHNSGPYTGDPYFWIINAILMGLIAYQKKETKTT